MTDLLMVLSRAQRVHAARVVSQAGDLTHVLITQLVAGAVSVVCALDVLTANLWVAMVT